MKGNPLLLSVPDEPFFEETLRRIRLGSYRHHAEKLNEIDAQIQHERRMANRERDENQIE